MPRIAVPALGLVLAFGVTVAEDPLDRRLRALGSKEPCSQEGVALSGLQRWRRRIGRRRAARLDARFVELVPPQGVVVGSDSVSIERSWGSDSRGQERIGPGFGGASGQGTFQTKDTSLHTFP